MEGRHAHHPKPFGPPGTPQHLGGQHRSRQTGKEKGRLAPSPTLGAHPQHAIEENELQRTPQTKGEPSGYGEEQQGSKKWSLSILPHTLPQILPHERGRPFRSFQNRTRATHTMQHHETSAGQGKDKDIPPGHRFRTQLRQRKAAQGPAEPIPQGTADLQEGVGLGQRLRQHQVGKQCALGGLVKRVQQGQQKGEDVHPGRCQVSLQQHPGNHQHQAHFGQVNLGHPAGPHPAVGQRTGQHAAQQTGQAVGQGDARSGQGRPGGLIHEPHHARAEEHVTEQGGRMPGPEPPEGAGKAPPRRRCRLHVSFHGSLPLTTTV